MANTYIDKLKEDIPKEIRRLGRSESLGSQRSLNQETKIDDFFIFWLEEMNVSKEDFTKLCYQHGENELCNFIFGTYAEDNIYKACFIMQL